MAVILYIFSIALLFSSYYINTIFNDPVISQSVSFKSLQTIMGTFTLPQSSSINSALIFGDFMATYQLLGTLFTGGIFNTAVPIFSNSGFADGSVQLLMGLLFDSATLFFILYIISNRSI